MDHGGHLARWKAALPARFAATFFPRLAAPLVEPLRMVKDEDELALMSEAALLGCKLFEHILTFIRPGWPEIEVAAELEHQARLLGAEGMSFETIVAAGARSALPHGRATAAKLPRRWLCDPGLRCYPQRLLLGYDPHRLLGQAEGRRALAYEAVLEAQEAGVAAVAPGASCGEVDEAARGVLRRAGLAEAFTHSTGHGVGLEIHEPPRVGAGQTPGCLPAWCYHRAWNLSGRPLRHSHRGHGGCNPTGGQVLTPAPKALIEL
jgi:Xaa-Pro aminopeptidase